MINLVLNFTFINVKFNVDSTSLTQIKIVKVNKMKFIDVLLLAKVNSIYEFTYIRKEGLNHLNRYVTNKLI